jgi:hypothetical protein
MPLSPEDQTFITQCRLRSAEGTITLDDMKRAIIILRDNRTAAQVAAATSKASKPRKSAPSAASVADALADLDAM